MTIVVAFILDAFVFCIEFRKKHQNSASKLLVAFGKYCVWYKCSLKESLLSPEDTHKVVFQTYLTRDELELVDPHLAQTDRVSITQGEGEGEGEGRGEY
jgi:hypothetical protein